MLKTKLQSLEVDEKVVLLIQGPETTALKVKRWLERNVDGDQAMKGILVIAGLTSGEPDRLQFEGRDLKSAGKKRKRLPVDWITDKTCRLEHAMVGGIIQHQWTFVCSFDIDPRVRDLVTKQVKVRSTLQDVLSHTEEGQEVGPPKSVEVTVPWKRRRLNVISPSVFSKTKWVKRSLTTKEMMDIYDVTSGYRETSEVMKNTNTLGCEFTQQIPSRVLQRCLEEILIPMLRKGAPPRYTSDSSEVKDSWNESRLESELMRRQTTSLVQGREVEDVKEKGASKNDDAEVQVQEWNMRVARAVGLNYHSDRHDKVMDTMRRGLFRRYCNHRHGVIGSFKRFMRQEYGQDWLNKMREERNKNSKGDREIVRSYDVGIDAIRRALGGTFWEWNAGSTVFFWRWPKCLWQELRDGVEVWFRRRELPNYWGRQQWPDNKENREQLEEKIQKVVDRGYIKPGYVKSLTSFFAVPKGEGDIRVVYDATRSGLNDAIWSPNFFLPTMSSVLASADDSTFFGDIDLGEMFLNYFLDPALQPYAGVDVAQVFDSTKAKSQRKILRWERSLMGVRSSPFNCVRLYLLSEDIIKGDRDDPSNPFRWNRIVYNLPGTVAYDATKPWVYKMDDSSGCMASFVNSYVDDLRTGSQRGADDCDRVTHCTASKLNYLGEQDAARKRRQATQKPGPWAGAVMEPIKGEGLYVSTTVDKWKRTKEIIDFYFNMLGKGVDEGTLEIWLDRKVLEKHTGFLVHMFMAFENMRPYLKGFYLTLNGWRFDRDESGWKLGKRHWEDAANELWDDKHLWKEAKEKVKDNGFEPSRVMMVPQMRRDVSFLKTMFSGEQPTKRLIRGSRIARIVYGFGDASGAGFGASWVDGSQLQPSEVESAGQESHIKYRFGRWGKEAEGKSSNFRELCNLVEALEEMGKSGDLAGVEVFLFTDNSTAEAAFNRGSSSSPLLYGLVKRVKLLEMIFKARVHVIHVAGTRMIDQGTDGLSRGCLMEGVMQGKSILSFIPLHQTAIERSTSLLAWLQDAFDKTGKEKLTVLEGEDWFWRGQDITGGTTNVDGQWVPEYATGQYIWAPPPCIAVRCIEELRRARHKRQTSTHVFVCPRIMTVEWQKHLYRSADVVLVVNPGHTAWEQDQHEPLILGFYFPYLRHEPWQLKGSPKVVGMAGHLQRVCKENPGASGCLLRQLWQFTRELSSMPEQLVRQVLQGAGASEVSKTVARKRRRPAVEEKEG